jgi:hypothetical protein
MECANCVAFAARHPHEDERPGGALGTEGGAGTERERRGDELVEFRAHQRPAQSAVSAGDAAESELLLLPYPPAPCRPTAAWELRGAIVASADLDTLRLAG